MYTHRFIFAKFFIVTCCSIYAASSRHNTKVENDFECPENWGYYEDPENCMKYYNCENGVAHSVNCRSENGVQLLYDHPHNYCDWPERVDCGNRPICDENNQNCDKEDATTSKYKTTTSVEEKTTGKENDFTCPDHWGYYGDPKNCIKYYICEEGIPTRMICQKENGIQLHYNEDNVWCDWPDKVNCGNRPICDTNDENCE